MDYLSPPFSLSPDPDTYSMPSKSSAIKEEDKSEKDKVEPSDKASEKEFTGAKIIGCTRSLLKHNPKEQSDNLEGKPIVRSESQESNEELKDQLDIHSPFQEEKSEASAEKKETIWNKATPTKEKKEKKVKLQKKIEGKQPSTSVSTITSIASQTSLVKSKTLLDSCSCYLDALASGSLGVINSKANAELQTKAFHRLKLKEHVSSHSEDLSKIQIDFKKPGSPTLETKTLVGIWSVKEQTEISLSLIGGSFVNNYPPDNTASQINCDCFHSEAYSDYLFSIMADGCGWGSKSNLAAQRAVSAAAQFINQMAAHSSCPIKRAKNMAWVLIQAMAMAHEAIISAENDLSTIGTTTLNICFAFTSTKEKKFLLVAGVGDCKTFIATRNYKNQYQVSEVSSSKRLENLNLTDPGGRLGPCVGKTYVDPDLRNLSVTCIALPDEESIILNMTDGVYDNLNPMQLGKDPRDVDISLSLTTQWTDLDNKKCETLMKHYQNELLANLINQAMLKKAISLNALCQFITTYCQDITAPGRKFMKENPTRNEPTDRKVNPGKMDHCTVTAFKF